MENDFDVIYKDLSAPYDFYAQTRKWDLYISQLLTDGLNWFFNQHVQRLSSHLKPLTFFSPYRFTTRLIFLTAALSPETPVEAYEVFYNGFKEDDDVEYAIAACTAAVMGIIHEGNAWKRFRPWYHRLEQGADAGDMVDALARASAKVTMGIIDAYCRGDYHRAVATFKEALSLAEKSPIAISLKVYLTAHLCFCYLQMGRFSEIELVLFDVAPLVSLPDTSAVSWFHYWDMLGVINCRSGKIKQGKWMLIEIETSPIFSMLPLGSRFLKMAHLMEAAIADDDRVLITQLADRMSALLIPERSFFYIGYRHCFLAIANLALGKPQKALEHLRPLAERAELLEGFGEQKYRHALLTGQALADLKRNGEAVAHFAKWVPKMVQSGKSMFASASCLEWAKVLMQQGEIDDARRRFDAARRLIPENEPLNMIYRSPARLSQLEHILFSRVVSLSCFGNHLKPPIRILTFGDLRLEICDELLTETEWRGRRPRLLLKALIVSGGMKVPLPVLADLLWPDAEGDRAINCVRVTITRLRKIACRKEGTPLPWLKVKHGHVSICTSFCEVDAIQFERWGQCISEDSDMPLLKRALDLYTDDFLANNAEDWIASYRRQLRKQFIKWTLIFSDYCLKSGKGAMACEYVSRALQKAPLDESVCACLIRALCKTGRKSEAVRLYQQMERRLMDELGIRPGDRLLSLNRTLSSYKISEN